MIFHRILPITRGEVVSDNNLIGEKARLRTVRCFVQVHIHTSDFTLRKIVLAMLSMKGIQDILLCFALLLFLYVAFFTN